VTAGPGWATDRLGRLLAEGSDHARLVRGTELADLDRVHDIDLRPGRVTATVIGTRGDGYEVLVRVDPDAGPPDDPEDIRTSCTCPDWAEPCKHAIAVLLTVAERLDVEPELAEVLWGRGRGPQPRPVPPPPVRGRPTPPARPAAPATAWPPPTQPPSWAEGIEPPARPRTAEALFGTARVGRAPRLPGAPGTGGRAAAPATGPGAGPGAGPVVDAAPDPAAVLDVLGPLEVGGVDLAPSLRALAARLADDGP
jgi:hypothetical protein